MPAYKTATMPLRKQMIADVSTSNLNPHTQRSHVQSFKRFDAYLGWSPDTSTDD